MGRNNADFYSGTGNHTVLFPNIGGANLTTTWDTPPSGRTISTDSAIGNETYKQNSDYWKSGEGKDYPMDKLINDMRGTGAMKLPPTIHTPHPADPSKNLILDGNHRTWAAKQAGSPFMKSHQFTHDQVHLSPTDPNHESTEPAVGIPLSKFRDKNGGYDMNAERPELGGRPLSSYFASTENNNG
jgi:hypothetical protein